MNPSRPTGHRRNQIDDEDEETHDVFHQQHGSQSDEFLPKNASILEESMPF